MNSRVCVLAAVAATFLPASNPPRPVPVQPPIQSPSPTTRAEFVERLESLYREVDTKARGYFTAADLTMPGYHIAYPPVPYPLAQAQAPFRCVDANRDRKISHEEYIGYGARAFDATARNGLMDPWGGNLTALARAISNAGCK